MVGEELYRHRELSRSNPRVISRNNAPGVYIEEQPRSSLIAGVSTGIAAFVGPTVYGPVNEARRVTNYDEFLAHYATAQPDGTISLSMPGGQPFYLAHAVRGFFSNGGKEAYVVRVGAVPGQHETPKPPTRGQYEEGINVLGRIDGVNLLCIPDAAAHPEQVAIQQAMIKHCRDLQDRFAILDPPPIGKSSIEQHRRIVQDYPKGVRSEGGFAALYYPWLEVLDPSGTGPIPGRILVPPSGHIAGVYARSDAERGVHHAPANTPIQGAIGLEDNLMGAQMNPFNQAGVNVLCLFPGSAQVVVWGARTTADPSDTDWRYVNVRRVMLYIEESIAEGVQWAVFEPNNSALWQKLKRSIQEFLTRVWNDGALAGATAEQAFYVRIDEELNPPSLWALGKLIIEIGLAPIRPAEFIIVRLDLSDGGAAVTEV
jgi:uncharacterized protein